MDVAKLKIQHEIDNLIKYSAFNSVVTSCRSKLRSQKCKECYNNLKSIIPQSNPIYVTIEHGFVFYFENSLPTTLYIPKAIVSETFLELFHHNLDILVSDIQLDTSTPVKSVIIDTKEHKRSMITQNKILELHNNLKDGFDLLFINPLLRYVHNPIDDSLMNDLRYLCKQVYKIHMCLEEHYKYIRSYNNIKSIAKPFVNNPLYLEYPVDSPCKVSHKIIHSVDEREQHSLMYRVQNWITTYDIDNDTELLADFNNKVLVRMEMKHGFSYYMNLDN